jgi:hypothetical protein
MGGDRDRSCARDQLVAARLARLWADFKAVDCCQTTSRFTTKGTAIFTLRGLAVTSGSRVAQQAFEVSEPVAPPLDVDDMGFVQQSIEDKRTVLKLAFSERVS